MNFSASWVRNASVGTMTSNFSHPIETRIDSIVSVLPVPVGMTIVAVASETVQCEWVACMAPNLGPSKANDITSCVFFYE